MVEERAQNGAIDRAHVSLKSGLKVLRTGPQNKAAFEQGIFTDITRALFETCFFFFSFSLGREFPGPGRGASAWSVPTGQAAAVQPMCKYFSHGNAEHPHGRLVSPGEYLQVRRQAVPELSVF